jgi:hypothetical protein
MVRHTVRRFAPALLLLIGLTLSAAPVLNAAAEVEIAGTGSPGEYLFRASGFKSEEVVSTWLTGPQGQVMEGDYHDVGARGRVTFTMRMPRHFQPGRWAITIHGLKSNREAIGYFDVPRQLPTATLTVTPASGPAGTTFSFAGSGFQSGEIVSYWLTSPDDKAYQGGAVSAGGDGSVAFSFTIGSGTLSGQWHMTAYGNKSDAMAIAAFQIT